MLSKKNEIELKECHRTEAGSYFIFIDANGDFTPIKKPDGYTLYLNKVADHTERDIEAFKKKMRRTILNHDLADNCKVLSEFGTKVFEDEKYPYIYWGAIAIP